MQSILYTIQTENILHRYEENSHLVMFGERRRILLHACTAFSYRMVYAFKKTELKIINNHSYSLFLSEADGIISSCE